MIESFQESQDSSINQPIESEERDNNEETGGGTTVGKSQSSKRKLNEPDSSEKNEVTKNN